MPRPAELEHLDPAYGDLHDAVAAAALRAGVRTVTLGGSLARGDADRYSDLDLTFVVEETAAIDAAAIVREATPTVLLRTLPFGVVAITPDWLRVDVVVTTGEAAQPTRTPDLPDLVDEFLRVLGLLPVVAGHGEWIVGWNAVAMLRRMLLDLLLFEGGKEAATGAKRVNPKLTAEQHAVMTGLPPLDTTGESVIGCHVADAFLPRARQLVAEWPYELEHAMRAHLRRELGIELAPV